MRLGQVTELTVISYTGEGLNSIAKTEEEIMRYLLGQCSEEEQIHIEGRYLSDDGFLELVLLAEEELIDNYVQGRLNERQREQFETYYLVTDERREKMAFAVSLRAYSQQSVKPVDRATTPPPAPRSFFKLMIFEKRGLTAAAFAAGLLLIAVGWLAVETMRLRSELVRSKTRMVELEESEQLLQQQIVEERARNEQLVEHVEELQNPQIPEGGNKSAYPSAIAMLVIAPGITRDISKGNTLILSPGVKTARLRLVFRNGDYQSYRATIRNPANEQIWVQTGMKASARGESKSVVVSLPAALLKSDDYMLILSGITKAGNAEDVNEYQFLVKRR